KIDIPEDGFEKGEEEPDAIFGTDPEIKQKILPALPEIKSAFTALRTKYNNFLGVTSFYYKDNNIYGQEYPPHLALCITFLHLFQHLQNQLNDVSREHLNFYYKDVLGLHPRSAVPDSVHIVFDPASLERVDLEEGEELQAEVDGNTLYYSLNE